MIDVVFCLIESVYQPVESSIYHKLQMVRLYKDPEGEGVFTAHEEAMQVTTVLGVSQPQLSDNESDSLKKKVKQLEDIIVEYKVLCTVIMVCQYAWWQGIWYYIAR